MITAQRAGRSSDDLASECLTCGSTAFSTASHILLGISCDTGHYQHSCLHPSKLQNTPCTFTLIAELDCASKHRVFISLQ